MSSWQVIQKRKDLAQRIKSVNKLTRMEDLALLQLAVVYLFKLEHELSN